MPNLLKKGTDTPQVELKSFTVVRKCYIIITDLAISLVLTVTLLGNKPKKFDFVHQTVSHWEAHTGWAQDYTRIC